jgi:hypothetical protein
MFQGVAQSFGASHGSAKNQDGHAFQRIAAAILLGGSVRSSEFQDEIGRSSLDLPYTAGKTILSAWCNGIREMAVQWGAIPIRILADPMAASALGSVPPAAIKELTVVIGKDPIEWRGTGGVLRDISGEYAPDQFLLVATASQVLMRPLAELVNALAALRSDVAVLAHQDGMPSTMMLIRCGCLAELPSVGFLDMKEQAIPQLAGKYAVKVIQLPRAVALGVRTARSYLAALREYHLSANGNGHGRETWRSAFSIVEEGSEVGTGARLHDSVMLRGASLGSGAVLVRSILCSGAYVPAKRVVVDRLVLPDGRHVPTEETT